MHMQIENIYWKLDLVMLERAGFSNCSYTTTVHNSRILHVVVGKKKTHSATMSNIRVQYTIS